MNIPIYFPLICIACVVWALYLYADAGYRYYESIKAGMGLENVFIIIIVSCSLLTTHAWLSAAGWYSDDNNLPWRLTLAFLVSFFLLTVQMYRTGSFGRRSIYGFTLLQGVRFPLELLYFVMARRACLPVEATLGGYNLDVFVGASAPIIAVFCYRKNIIPEKIGHWWQLLSMLSLLISSSLLLISVSSPLQLIGYEQPNILFEFFPFNWIPALLIPVLLVTQVSLFGFTIRKLYFS